MDFDEINKILQIVREHELSEFELEREGFKIRIRKGSLAHPSAPLAHSALPVAAHPAHAAPPTPAAAPEAVPSAGGRFRPTGGTGPLEPQPQS